MLSLLITLSLGAWGAEVPVETPPSTVLTSPNASPWSATVTGWEDSFLVAWQDKRFARVPVVMVARVTFDGGVEDPLGLVASNWNASSPAVSARGQIAAIAWETREAGWLRLLRRDGQWLTPPRQLGGRCPAVSMGSTGGVFVSESGRLQATRFDSNGALIDVMPIELSTASVPQGTCARVAIDDSGQTAMVMWRDETTQTVQTVSLPMTGPSSMPTTIGSGVGGGGVALTSIGIDRWFGVSAFTPADPLVRLQGYELSTTALAVQVPFLNDNAWLSLDLDRCAYGICFAATNDGPGITLSLGNFPLDGGAPIVAIQQTVSAADWGFAVTRGGDVVALAMADYQSAMVSIERADLGSSGLTQTLNRGLPAQLEPDVAVVNGVALVAWIEQDSTTGVLVVRGRRFDAAGAALDVNARTLIAPVLGDALSEVELMADERGWLVAASAWSTERSWLAHVDLDGAVTSQRELGVRGLHLGFVLAGDRVLASAKQYQTVSWDPVLVTISPNAGENTTRLQDNGAKEHFTDVAVTGNGEQLVVWQDADPEGLLDGIVAGKRVAEDGSVIDTTALRLSPPGMTALEPQVVGDGLSGYFLAWRSYGQLWVQHVKGGLASPAMALLDAPLVYDLPGDLHLTASRTHAVVSFTDPSDGGVLARELSLAEGGGVELSPLEPLAELGFDAFPAIAVANNVVWATYARADTTANAMRVYVRRWQRLQVGSTCSAGWMCKSNTCEGSACRQPIAPDAGNAGVNDAGLVILPDGGAVLPDGGTPPARGKWQLGVGPSCSSGDESLMVMFSALLAWRRSRRKC